MRHGMGDRATRSSIDMVSFWSGYYWLAVWVSLAIIAGMHAVSHHTVGLVYDLVFAAWSLLAQLLAIRWSAWVRLLHSLSVLPFTAYYCNAPGALMDDAEKLPVYILLSSFPIYTASAMAGITGAAVSLALATVSGMSLLTSSRSLATLAAIDWGLVVMVGHAHHHLIRMLREHNRRLTTLALSDPLTGLGNRRALQQDFNRYRDLAQREDKRLIMTLWDLNGLKEINDAHGHAIGDGVIKKFAQVVTGSVRRSDPFYRIGGDEFVGLHVGIQNPDELIRRIRAQSPSVSAGWADSTDLSFEEAYKQADRDMYESKASQQPEPTALEFDERA